MIFRTASFTPSYDRELESFVLRCDDLNLQNSFCDLATGAEIGIINWERAAAVLRYIGFSALPVYSTPD
jgi:hypothetical protein